MSSIATEAALHLASVPNFRDLGGYRTQDGRRVRYRTVFRSGLLSMAEDGDLALIESFGIRSVFDLRARDERARRPARWATAPEESYGSDKETLAGAMRDILTPETSVDEARAGFTAFNARLPELYREEYTALFSRLVSGPFPLLIKCTAGKDRTGLACALLLTSLGVPRETVLADYAETNARLPAMKRQRAEGPVGGKAGETMRRALASPEVLDVMWAADPAYLAAAFAAIERDHGSAVGYLDRALGIDAAGIARLRERLTEPA